MTHNTATTATTTTIYVAIPEGPLVRGRVEVISDAQGQPDQVHPGAPHLWRHMDHFGRLGTGFAECFCGAMGVPYRRLEEVS